MSAKQASETIVEPVIEAIPVALKLAAAHCPKDDTAGPRCDWLHGLWPALRALDLVTSPQHHADFFKDAISALAHAGKIGRVLISGAVDFSMFAHALAALRAAQIDAAYVAVDRCATPMRLTQWYAERVGAKVEIAAASILDYNSSLPFDLICTHSFLGQFSPELRPALIKKWHALLRPGGAVVTINRVRPRHSAEKAGFSPEQAKTFADMALDRFRKRRPPLAMKETEFAAMVADYTRRQRAYPVRSRQEIEDLFAAGGFAIERLELGLVGDAGHTQPSGPTAPGSADYAKIVARRL